MTMQAKHVVLKSGQAFDVHFIPVTGSEEEFTEAACLAFLPDHSAQATAIFSGALMQKYRVVKPPKDSTLVPPNEQNLCGINLEDRFIRKGNLQTIDEWLRQMGGILHNRTRAIVEQVIRRRHEAIVVADHEHDLGVIELVEV
jgi:high-affinity K+ transport system ATPase subunit B